MQKYGHTTLPHTYVCKYIEQSLFRPHHNNVRTTTVVVVVVRTLHSILKNDRTRTVIRTSKCAVQMTTNPQK